MFEPGESQRERIARRAYELWLERGGEHGSDLEDWLAAEQEIAGDSASTPGSRATEAFLMPSIEETVEETEDVDFQKAASAK